MENYLQIFKCMIHKGQGVFNLDVGWFVDILMVKRPVSLLSLCTICRRVSMSVFLSLISFEGLI